ncbi:MAG TPA: hypothetical protein PLK77_11815 [Pyrinomonadaceae bacterium]|nr:hypothetical protein [Pyrinomonadaceae bacterium]
MSDAEVRFEREDAEGLVAVGSYLSDAAKRFGVKFESECVPATGEHFCQVQIVEGSKFLSEKTAAENEAKLEEGWRIACHAKIEKAGEIVVMTKEKPAAVEEEKDKAEDYRKRFEDLPLEKKMAELVTLEGMALSETLSFVVNSPYKVADKVMDFLAEFGFKMDSDKKESAKPEEHRANGENGAKAESAEVPEEVVEEEDTIIDSEERKDA